MCQLVNVVYVNLDSSETSAKVNKNLQGCKPGFGGYFCIGKQGFYMEELQTYICSRILQLPGC